MLTTNQIGECPQLRHCTLLTQDGSDELAMIVGKDRFHVTKEFGQKEDFLRIKSLLDGRHSIEEIAGHSRMPEGDVRAILESFRSLGLLRQEKPTVTIDVTEFLGKLDEACLMWSRQIGYHLLFQLLRRGEARKEVFIGLVLETYHYIKAASQHTSAAIAHCYRPDWQHILVEYFTDECNHDHLALKTLENLGMPRSRAESAHPLIGTMSLINTLSEMGRVSTLAYLAGTSLFEARKEDYDAAKADFERIAANYGFQPEDVAPLVDHLRADVAAGHTSLIEEALGQDEVITAAEAHLVVNCLHDLKHSYDQFHDQILQYYGDISNYIPRLKVDYFSL